LSRKSPQLHSPMDEMPPATDVAADAVAPDGTHLEVQRNYGKPRTAMEILAALKESRKGTKAKAKAPAVQEAEAKEAAGILAAAVSAPATPAATPPAPVAPTVPPAPKAARKPKAAKSTPSGRPAPEPPAEAPPPTLAAPAPAPSAPSVTSVVPDETQTTEQPVPEAQQPTPAPKPKPLTPAQLKARREAQARFAGMKPMHVVEAALFSAGKPLLVEEIAETTGLRAEVVKDGIKELVSAYDGRDSVLEVGKAGAKWAMQVRSRAAEPASKFAPMEIPHKTLKTLALIAYHQPMKQSDLVDMVGTKVYDHVPELVSRGLVRAREEGVTKILTTTHLFPEYFGLDAEDTEGVRATLAKLVGLPPPPPKEQGPAVVYEETQAQVQAEGGTAGGAEAAGPDPAAGATAE
jgi:segregation and condensation protein B